LRDANGPIARSGDVIRRALALAALALLAAPAVARADGPQIGVSYTLDGITAATGGTRYVTLPLGRRTVLEAIRTEGGQVAWMRTLPGWWGTWQLTTNGDTGGLSRNGRLLVLGTPAAGYPVRSTRLLLYTMGHRRYRIVRLHGDFSFDALSPDAKTLYLIQHVGSAADSAYRVRAYDTESRRLLPGVIAERWAGSTTMRGVPIERATGPGGQWEFTLYQAPDGSSAFVHALDTVHRFAMCIDIPKAITPEVAMLGIRLDANRALELVTGGQIVGRIDLSDLRLHKAPADSPHVAGSTPPASDGDRPWAPVAAGLAAILAAAAAALAVRRRRRHAVS
jgi:hypothetical protein